jgi:glycine/D-amino acid oxidase-like deaminating enzyme
VSFEWYGNTVQLTPTPPSLPYVLDCAGYESQGNGSLLLATTPDEVSSLEARMGTLQAAGVTDAHMLTSQQLAELEPALRLPQGSAGLHVPSDGQLVSRQCCKQQRCLCTFSGSRACHVSQVQLVAYNMQ